MATLVSESARSHAQVHLAVHEATMDDTYAQEHAECYADSVGLALQQDCTQGMTIMVDSQPVSSGRFFMASNQMQQQRK